MDQENRVVVLIDMDCFYCQVEEKLNPELRGKPIAVVQYNPWKGGGIIAVNYVARAMGVTRHMRGDEAKEKCPEIHLPSVPCQRGKADITKYRDAGKEVARVLQKFTPLLERASIDEAYLDITAPVQERLKCLTVQSVSKDMLPNTFALGYNNLVEFMNDTLMCSNECIDFDYMHSKQLLIGAVIVSEIRAAVFNETGYQCSAGIAHNKILAKLVCGMNKPNKQTILPKHSVNILYESLSLKKVKNLGGKFGDSVCELLKIKTMGELQKFSERQLQDKFDEKNGTWLYNIARGVDLEPVQAKFNPKSIGCCKQFRGKAALIDLLSLKKWLRDLGDEIEDRLENDALENNRTPKQMVVSFSTQLTEARDVSSSRSYNFANEDELCGELLYNKAYEIIMESVEATKPKDNEENRKLKAPIKFLGISVGKFEDHSENKKTKKILDYFAAGASKNTCDKNISKFENTFKQKDDNDNEHKKKKVDECYIMQKFLQYSGDKNEACNIKIETKLPLDQTVMESNLDKQESFFAKYLKKSTTNDDVSVLNALKEEMPNSTICNVVECGNDSNDSNYSASTIEMEINKSVALFDNDPQDTIRVSNMRNFLGSSVKIKETDVEKINLELVSHDNPNNSRVNAVHTTSVELAVCKECNKHVPVNELDTHSDYHLALKIRNEDRELLRKNATEKARHTENIKNVKVPELKQNNESSIAQFFVKLDHSIPLETCSQCGKRVPLENFTEHLDFHKAQQLNRELNKKPSKPEKSQPTNSMKRKRKSASPVKKIKVPCKPINTFFK